MSGCFLSLIHYFGIDLFICFLLDVKEQAVDREHERDFFQQEIQKLEQQLKNQQKQQAGSEHRNQEVMGKKNFF